ncbi:hypothetical protein BYT27DRAFT_7128762 [Phlegmacium glaucopus]|nr:hypothetical protein BYT27DRAFT_7128762 [Phlegmacium glaucopus]
MTAIPRTSSDLVQISRAEQRKQRLRELETEQAAEEAEALKMTEEQRQTLLKSFTSVKVEFTDLDGLRWSQTALRKIQPFHRSPARLSTSQPKSKNTFVVLTNADLASFSPEDTIRVSASTTQLWPRYPGQQTTTPHLTTLFPQPPRWHRDGSRSRSPIKGVFQPESSHEDSDSFKHPIDAPYFVPSDSSDGNVIPVADNGFVTKHKQRVVSRGRRKLVRPPGLLPVDSLESRPQDLDSVKERIPQRRQTFSTTDTHDLLSVSTVPPPKDTLYHPPTSPVLSHSPLIVHSFVMEPPSQIYSPQHARVRLHSILNGTIPPRPVPFPVDPDTTPSPFLLSSATFGNGMVQDPFMAGDASGDDETPTTSPIMETGENWIR